MSPRNLTNPVSSRPGFAIRVLEHRAAQHLELICVELWSTKFILCWIGVQSKKFLSSGDQSRATINTKTSFCLLCEFTHYPAPLIFVRKLFPNWKAGFFDNFSQIFFMIFPWFFMIFPIFPGFFDDFSADFCSGIFFLMIFFPRFFDDFFLGFFSTHFLVGNEFSDKIIGFWTVVFFFSYY